MAQHPDLTDAEQLAKAQEPARVANDLHRFYQGKVETALRCRVRDFNDFAIWYTPGVAEPCKAIAADPDLVYDYTHKGNTVAIISDGTRVLGLGDIGPKAGLPVMEGKALLYKYLGGVDAWPIMVDTHDPNVLIETVLRITPGFGGINLEDIAQPKCFRVLDELRNRAEVPIWHDDQQGTATVVLAGLINALKVVGKKPGEVRVVFVGSGASNVACARLAFASGINPANCRIVDSKGILTINRTDIFQHRDEFCDKWRLCQTTNAEGVSGGIAEALRGADVVIALSRPGPGVIKPEWIRTMATDPVVFACANPTPEIWPWEAREAGAAVVATGRSDFPNQINNSLVFPGIFRGALDVRARTVTDEMCLAAAHALADMASEHGLDPEYIVPTMDEWHVFPREAAAVAVEATRQNVARKPTTYQEEYARAEAIIGRSRKMTRRAMEEGFIPAPAARFCRRGALGGSTTLQGPPDTFHTRHLARFQGHPSLPQRQIPDRGRQSGARQHRRALAGGGWARAVRRARARLRRLTDASRAGGHGTAIVSLDTRCVA